MVDMMRKMIVGLGNPGRRYQDNRHNIGFLLVDELLRRMELNWTVEEPTYLATAARFCADVPVLMKPLTYMNLSGEAVVGWADRADEPVSGLPWPPSSEHREDLGEPGETADPGPEPFRPLVVCDDLALPLGAVRLRGKGSSGGQNGVESLIDHLGGRQFPRLRLGIAPKEGPVPPELWPDYVLADFELEEHDDVREVIAHAADAVEFWIQHGTEATGSRFNRKTRPAVE